MPSVILLSHFYICHASIGVFCDALLDVIGTWIAKSRKSCVNRNNDTFSEGRVHCAGAVSPNHSRRDAERAELEGNQVVSASSRRSGTS